MERFCGAGHFFHSAQDAELTAFMVGSHNWRMWSFGHRRRNGHDREKPANPQRWRDRVPIRITGKIALAFDVVRCSAFGRLFPEIGTLNTWPLKRTGRYDARAVLPPRPVGPAYALEWPGPGRHRRSL